MKLTYLLLLITSIGLGVCSARTWTSADGKKTFEADFRSFNPTTGEVAVVKNGQMLKFKKEMLSEADIKFVTEFKKESGSPAELVEAKLAEQAVGAKLVKTDLHRLDGKRFKKTTMEAAPEYYLLYFSASW